jgi:hypothetical protein
MATRQYTSIALRTPRFMVAGALLTVLCGAAGASGQPSVATALPRNIARLNQECPGGAAVVVWLRGGATAPAGDLADGETNVAARLPAETTALGVQWPIAHVINAASVVFAGDIVEPRAVILEVHDGRRWRRIATGLNCDRHHAEHRLAFSFEPVATQAFRVRFSPNEPMPRVAEIEVHRYLPSGPKAWPERLVASSSLEREMLASGEEPSFERLATLTLSMTPARALLGLKDASDEVGVTWDGTILAADALRFSFGQERRRLADVRDTVCRTLVDGWRPGTVVEGRLGDIAVRETALVAPMGENSAHSALWVRIELENLSHRPMQTCVEAELSGKRTSEMQFRDGRVVLGNQIVLCSQSAALPGATRRVLRVELSLGPRKTEQADFIYPQGTLGPETMAACVAKSFDCAMTDFRQYWDKVLAPAAKIEVPEERVNHLYKAVLSQIFINGDGDIMYYGAAPSAYDKSLFGVEEGYCMRALAFSGFGDDAQRYIDATYLTPKFLGKVEQYHPRARHQQYRNGLVPHYAVTLYRFTRDRSWIARHAPLLKECAEWTIAQRRRTMTLDEDGKKPPHWGMLPKWAYGGDIGRMMCYPLYPNYCCWRGLVDTAWLMEELGDADAARRYAKEAQEYRAVLDAVVESLYRRNDRPPWLPLRLGASKVDEGDFYQLFAGCLLDVAPFDPRSRQLRYVTDFLEADNREFFLLPRFRGFGAASGVPSTRDIGAGGLDGIYGLGYVLSKLHADEIDEFLLGFYGYLAFNMDRETFAARETNVIYASDVHIRTSYGMPDMSDPLPCGSAVALHYLRNMLVTEELGAEGSPTGKLLLLAGVPRRWLDGGQTIRIDRAPTHFGPISLEVVSHARTGQIEAKVTAPHRNACDGLRLRLPRPDDRRMVSVTVNDQPWADVELSTGWISLPPGNEPYHIVARYADP